MRTLGFHHLAIQVQDLERSLRFYRDLLGLEELARYPFPDGSLRSVWVALPGGGFLALEKVDGTPEERLFRHETPGLFLLTLRIAPEDRPELLSSLAKAGIAVNHESRWTVYVRDPEGNRIGFSHHPHDPIGAAGG